MLQITILIGLGFVSVSLARAEQVTFCLKGSEPNSKQVCFTGHQDATNLTADELKARQRELRYLIERRISEARARLAK
jgi:hypothetical protein